jgi:hypothetical protein
MSHLILATLLVPMVATFEPSSGAGPDGQSLQGTAGRWPGRHFF